MKKFLAALVLVAFSSLAFATTVAEVRVFQQSTSGSGWPEFLAELEKGGFLEEKDGKKVLSTAVIGYIANQYAVDNGHLSLVSEQYRETRVYVKAFLAYNGLGEFIELDEFRRRAQAEGFFLPIEHEWLAAQQLATPASSVSTETEMESSSPVSAETAAPATRQDSFLTNEVVDRVGEKLSKLGSTQARVESLQRELEVLKRAANATNARADIAAANSKRIKELEDTLNALSFRLAEMSGHQVETAKSHVKVVKAVEALEAVVDKQDQKMILLRQGLGAKLEEVIISSNWSQFQIGELWAAVGGATPQEAFSGLSAKVSNLLYGLVAVAAIMLVFMGLFARHVKMSRKNNLEQNHRIDQVEDDLGDVVAELLPAEDLSEEDRGKISKENLSQLSPGAVVRISTMVVDSAGMMRVNIVVEVEDDTHMIVRGIPRDEKDNACVRRVSRNTDILRMFSKAVRKKYYISSLRAVA